MDGIKLSKWLIVAAALFGASGVAFGAIGAHVLPARWESQGWSRDDVQRESQRLDIAVKYQLIHAVALLAIGVLAMQRPSVTIHLVGIGMVAGVLLFSGFLLSHTIWQSPVFLKIVPYGGTILILSWMLLAVAAFRIRLG